MIKLSRKGVCTPKGWRSSVLKALGTNAKAVRHKAQQFERLTLNGAKRRALFYSYAKHLLPTGKAGKPAFPPLWRTTKSIKKALLKMSYSQCAYCQSPAGADQSGHVEHFKPKSLFPTLAYDIKNYFFGCESCNLKKGDNWPKAGDYVRPDVGKPSTRFVFHDNGNIKPALGDLEAQATVRDFKLDRRGLRKARRLLIKNQLKFVTTILKQPTLSTKEKHKQIRTLLVRKNFPYSTAINQSVRRAWSVAFPGVPL